MLLTKMRLTQKYTDKYTRCIYLIHTRCIYLVLVALIVNHRVITHGCSRFSSVDLGVNIIADGKKRGLNRRFNCPPPSLPVPHRHWETRNK